MYAVLSLARMLQIAQTVEMYRLRKTTVLSYNGQISTKSIEQIFFSKNRVQGVKIGDQVEFWCEASLRKSRL